MTQKYFQIYASFSIINILCLDTFIVLTKDYKLMLNLELIQIFNIRGLAAIKPPSARFFITKFPSVIIIADTPVVVRTLWYTLSIITVDILANI